MHRKDNRTAVMVRHLLTIAALAALTALLVILAFATANQATAKTAGHTKLYMDRVTCQDFYAYANRPTFANFRAGYQASRKADTYLKADWGLWEKDRKHHKPAAVLSTDMGYVSLDCGVTNPDS